MVIAECQTRKVVTTDSYTEQRRFGFSLLA